jgi:hypothetical protein
MNRTHPSGRPRPLSQIHILPAGGPAESHGGPPNPAATSAVDPAATSRGSASFHLRSARVDGARCHARLSGGES